MDLREEFVRDFVFPMLRANAVYEGSYLLGTSIARPLIARAQVEIARAEGADAVAHGATGKGNDQVRFELTYAALAPDLRVIAPWREWELSSRTALLEFARQHDIPVPVTAERPYSTDRNLFHISYEGGILEDPWAEPPAKMFLLTNSPEAAPDVPVDVEIDFEAGDPVAVDGRRLGPVALLDAAQSPRRRARRRARGPGGEPLRGHEVARRLRDPRRHHPARRAAGSGVADARPRGAPSARLAGPRYAEMIYYGFWYSPERQALQGLMDECQRDVTGTVRLKLYKGNVMVAGRRSPRSLYRTDFATFETDCVYRQRDAEGFINLNALRLRIRALRDRR